MAELITETIRPGTYIEVRAEGLLSAGAFPTGNVGIIGTAEKGDGRIARLGSIGEAIDRFGEAGTWDPADPGSNLTLVRSLQLLFDNGASTVFALRVLDEGDPAAPAGSQPGAARAAELTLGAGGGTGLHLRARSAGSWGNKLQVRVESADGRELVANELLVRANGRFALSGAADQEAATLGTVVVREPAGPRRLPLLPAPDPAGTAVALFDSATRSVTLPAPPAADTQVTADYWVPPASLRKVTIRHANRQEVYVVPSLSYLAQRINDPISPSRLVMAGPLATDGLPAAAPTWTSFSAGSNGATQPAHWVAALERLVEEDVQILVVAGRAFSEVKAWVLAHLEKTENLGRERIAVVGADHDDVDKVAENANAVADDRLVLVAPGLRQKDLATGREIVLPPAYAAAAVAGKMAGLPPHISMTNKPLAGIDGLSSHYNDPQIKSLLMNRVLPIEQKQGIRVVKAISTDDGAFRQISVRRIVDGIKRGTRMGTAPYIGRLNNRRVRENLRTTLDSFLASRLLLEWLTAYSVKVSATRAQEIAGEVLVEMELQPTFSIDVILVVMNLS
jgi:hypothetical protein